jgi:predicted DNA-binding transcriptional regulator AlpA
MGCKSLQDLLAWLDQAPGGTLVAAEQVREILQTLIRRPPTSPEAPSLANAALSWRERIWTVPEQTRLGCRELAEAVGRPVSWVYRRTSERSGCGLIPHRKFDGELVFVASEIRSWIGKHEHVILEVCEGAGKSREV